MSILPLPVTTMSTSSSSFYQRKADEARQLAESEPNATLAEQHRRLARIYQSLADSPSRRPPGITIPKGLLRRA